MKFKCTFLDVDFIPIVRRHRILSTFLKDFIHSKMLRFYVFLDVFFGIFFFWNLPFVLFGKGNPPFFRGQNHCFFGTNH